MRKGGGKEKGNRWEREFCRDLSSWFSDGKSSELFWRADTLRVGEEARNKAGDVVAIENEGKEFTSKFGIELKCWGDSTIILDTIRPEKKSVVLEWWDKLIMACESVQKEPILVVKLTRIETYVFFRSGYALDTLSNRMKAFHSHGGVLQIYRGKYPYWLTMCTWKDFKEQYKRVYENGLN